MNFGAHTRYKIKAKIEIVSHSTSITGHNNVTPQYKTHRETYSVERIKINIYIANNSLGLLVPVRL